MPTPLTLRIEAVRGSSVDKVLGSLSNDAQKAATGFEAMARASDKVVDSTKKISTGGKPGSNSGSSSAGSKSAAQQERASEKAAADAVKAAQAEKSAARKKAAADAEYYLRQEDKYRQAVIAAERKAAGETKKAEAEKAAARKKGADALQNLGTGAVVGLTAASAVLGGLSATVLKVAGDFETLQARLTTVQGSSQAAAATFAEAVSYAAKTPFDVSGIVNATVTLEVYGQRSKEVLPSVAALAAGMGKDINATSLVVGKALSGSLEGFESLRNEYGITTRELVRFGAEQNKAGGIMVQSAAQADKARTALLAIIETRFGDAIERQSKTVVGVVSNAKDSIQNFAAEVGVGAGALVKLGAAFVGGGFDLFRSLPAEMKALAGAALLVGTGVTAVGAAGITAAAGLVALNTQLAAAAVTTPALAGAAATSAGAVTAMGTAATGVGTAFRFMLGPVGLAIAAVAALKIGFDNAADAQERMASEMKASSAVFQSRVRDLRDLNKEARELANADRKKQGLPLLEEGGKSDPVERTKTLKQALDTASTSEFFSRFKAIGLDAEQVRQEIGKVGGEIEAQKKAMVDLEKEVSSASADRSIKQRTEGTKTPRLAAAEEALKNAKAELGVNQELEKSLKSVDERYTANAKSLEKIGQAAASTDDYLKYAEKAGDVKTLNEAYGVSVRKLGEMKTELQKLNQPIDPKAALKELLSLPEESPLRDKIKQYLDQIEKVKEQGEVLTQKRAEGVKKEIDALEQGLARQKAVREVSAREELAILEQQKGLAVKLGSEGESELTRILGRESELRKKIRENDAKAAEKAASDTLKAISKVPIAAKTADKGTSEAVQAYDNAIKRTEDWVKANDKLISKFPELKTQANAALDSLKLGRQAAETARLAKGFDDLKDSIREVQDEAETTAEKITAVSRARELVKNARGANKISAEQATDLDRGLGEQGDDLSKTKAAEDLRHQQSLLGLKEQAAQRELEIAQTLADGSLRSNDQIRIATEKLFNFKKQQLELERDAAIQANEDKLQVEERYQQQLANLEQERTAEFHKQAKAQVDIERQKLLDIIALNQPAQDATNKKTNLQFGISDSPSFFTIGGGSAEEDDKRRKRKRAENELEKLDAGERFRTANPDIAARMDRLDSDRLLRAADPTGVLSAVGPLTTPSTTGASGGTTVNNNQTATININAKSGKTVEVGPQDVMKEVQKGLEDVGFYTGQTSGSFGLV